MKMLKAGLKLAVAALAFTAGLDAAAQGYPTRPVKIIVPATTGGDCDGDLPVPDRKASAHARVCDDAGLARVLR